MSTHTDTSAVPSLSMNDGNAIPQLGFGVFQVPPEDAAETVLRAFRTGYRSIDTAAAYQNEAAVGVALAESGLKRDEVFVTTKLSNNDHGHDQARRALRSSLERLGEEYVDLYLIHWPLPDQGLYVETWQALVELREQGLARSIGVSNFLPEHLERIIDATRVTPVLNQVELQPRLQQPELRRFHERHSILTEPWSPLGQGGVLDDPTIEKIAAEHQRTPAQVVLRWHLQLGNVVIPKSVTPDRIEENFHVFDFELSEEQMETIGKLDAGDRTGPDPADFSG